MEDFDELNRAIGRLEGKTNLLIHNQDALVTTVNGLRKSLLRRAWYDSAKVISGAFAGGFSAVFAKLAIWGS